MHLTLSIIFTILGCYGYSSSIIKLNKFLHLKTGVSYLGSGRIFVAGELIGHPEFKQFEQIPINDDDIRAANCIRVNKTLIMPKCSNHYMKIVQDLDLNIVTVDLSEFQKIDGGLSCLSLRF